jgi:hypothetical protein
MQVHTVLSSPQLHPASSIVCPVSTTCCFPLAAQQGSEPVPAGRGLQQFGDGCLFVTYSLLISGLGGRKAKAAAAEEEAEAALAGARRAANERMK